MQGITSLFAYIGPETIVPATSVLAAIGGFLLAFGRSLFRPVFAIFFRLIGRKQSISPAVAPVSEPSVAASESQLT